MQSVQSERMQEWVTEWGGIWGVPDLADSVRVTPGRRMRRSLGRCEPATGTIRLHPRLYAEPVEIFREVLCHEAAHVAVHVLYEGSRGRSRSVKPHGAEWAALMRAAGYAPRATVDVAALSTTLERASRPRYRYDHRCSRCGAQRQAGRAVRRWRCKKCYDAGHGGKLDIRRIAVAAL